MPPIELKWGVSPPRPACHHKVLLYARLHYLEPAIAQSGLSTRPCRTVFLHRQWVTAVNFAAAWINLCSTFTARPTQVQDIENFYEIGAFAFPHI